MLKRFLDGSPESPDGIAPFFNEVGSAPTAGNAVMPPGSIVRFGTTYYLQTGTLAVPMWTSMATLLTPGLAESYYRALALSRLGLSPGDTSYGFLWDDLDKASSLTAPTGWALANTGTGSYASQIAGGKGGQARMSTGATAGSFAQMFQEACLISAIGTQKWWAGNRFAVITAITAQSDASRGLINVASTKSILIGVWGPSSTVNFRLQYDGIATGTFLDLGVAIDTGYHLFEIYCKGDAKLYARVDEGAELSVTPASNPADSLQLFARIGNGTDVVARSMDTDFTACLYPR